VLEYTLFFADPGTLITDRGAEPALTSMSAIGSKTVLTPLKWDVCITPESRHRSATLPIAMSSSGNCGATSTLQCVDDETIGWPRRREQESFSCFGESAKITAVLRRGPAR
jgi:hypothetical protein